MVWFWFCGYFWLVGWLFFSLSWSLDTKSPWSNRSCNISCNYAMGGEGRWARYKPVPDAEVTELRFYLIQFSSHDAHRGSEGLSDCDLDLLWTVSDCKQAVVYKSYCRSTAQYWAVWDACLAAGSSWRPLTLLKCCSQVALSGPSLLGVSLSWADVALLVSNMEMNSIWKAYLH